VRVQQGGVALDITLALQAANPLVAGGGRKVHFPGQRDIGHAAVQLKVVEDQPICSVEVTGFPQSFFHLKTYLR
jgi:hypothetical protein